MSAPSIHDVPARRTAADDRPGGRFRRRVHHLAAAPTATATVLVEVGVSGSGALETATRLARRIRDLIDTDAPVGADLATSVGVRLGTTATPAPQLAEPAQGDGPPPWPVGVLRLYPARRVALIDEAPLTLTRREFDLLQFLAERPGRVFGRPLLLRLVWGHQVICGERTVDVHVRRLRAKLAGAGPVIVTVRGVGYRLDAGDRVAVIGAADPID